MLPKFFTKRGYSTDYLRYEMDSDRYFLNLVSSKKRGFSFPQSAVQMPSEGQRVNFDYLWDLPRRSNPSLKNDQNSFDPRDRQSHV